MKKAVVTSLVIALVFTCGCGVTKTENEAKLRHRVEEYHGFLINITDPEKAANDEYAINLLDYLAPTDPHAANLNARNIQNEWLKRNWKAQNSQKRLIINMETISFGLNGKSAVVSVTVASGDRPIKQAEKWVRIDNKWYRTLEFAY